MEMEIAMTAAEALLAYCLAVKGRSNINTPLDRAGRAWLEQYLKEPK